MVRKNEKWMCPEQGRLNAIMRPTKCALDTGDSVAFSRIFLASSFSCSQTESTPVHTQVTQTVRRHVLSQKAMKEKSNKVPTESVIRKPDTSTIK